MELSEEKENKVLFYSAMIPSEHYTGEYKEEFKKAWMDIDDSKFIEAFEKFKILANHGDKDSNLNIGVFYDIYEPMENHEKAFYYYEIAAKNNCAKAISYLAAKNLDSGNFDKANGMYASILDDKYYSSHGYYGLAQIYENGLGVKQDLYRAIKLMKIAAETDHSYNVSYGEAYMILGFYYFLIGDEEKEKVAIDKSLDMNFNHIHNIYEFYSHRDIEKARYFNLILTGKFSTDSPIEKNIRSSGGCFPANAMIKTCAGTKKISLIKKGDIVISYDKSLKEVERKVIKVKKHKNSYLCKLTFTDKSILVTTFSHSFKKDNSWMKVKNLSFGDVILCECNNSIMNKTILSIDGVKKLEPVYNLIVEKNFNFVVDGVLAHSFSNCRWLQDIAWSFINYIQSIFDFFINMFSEKKKSELLLNQKTL